MTFPENDVKTPIHLQNHDFHFPVVARIHFIYCDIFVVLWGGASIDLSPTGAM